MSDWITIHDNDWTIARTTSEVSQRAEERVAQLGSITVTFPTFGELSELPEPPQSQPYNANLYHHLRLINDMPPPDTTAVLKDSPATRTPFLGGIWNRIRGQFHELILFYVNRSVRQQTQLNNELINTLHELTRTIELQQEEIWRLREQLREQPEQE